MVQLKNFGTYLGLLWILLFLGDVFSALNAAVVPNFLMGLVNCCGFWSMSLLLQGFFIDLDSIPAYFQWVCWITPMSYSYQSFMLNQWSSNQTLTSTQFASGQSVLDFFGYGNGGLFARFTMGDDIGECPSHLALTLQSLSSWPLRVVFLPYFTAWCVGCGRDYKMQRVFFPSGLARWSRTAPRNKMSPSRCYSSRLRWSTIG